MITVVGSIAFDAVRTPAGARERMLGGAATHFALAASQFDRVAVVGPVGGDFGPDDEAVLATRGTDLGDLVRVRGGETFFWRGEYGCDLNSHRTLETRLNVFAGGFVGALACFGGNSPGGSLPPHHVRTEAA